MLSLMETLPKGGIIMTFTQKESSLLQELTSHEQLCVEKYSRFANEAQDTQLKNLFTQLGQVEQQHLDTLKKINAGTVPNMSGSSNQSAATNYTASNAANKQKDQYLCQDVLSTEKHVSALYNTCIFEFKDVGVRNALNHIQKEEQEHGQKIYSYMEQNGMY